ncbi:hypothetical protein FRB90_001140 [Tulasnella sp. 427]|nr:hypothetical protein FRB90_001140 [Tulasnella sp. 427]
MSLKPACRVFLGFDHAAASTIASAPTSRDLGSRNGHCTRYLLVSSVRAGKPRGMAFPTGAPHFLGIEKERRRMPDSCSKQRRCPGFCSVHCFTSVSLARTSIAKSRPEPVPGPALKPFKTTLAQTHDAASSSPSLGISRSTTNTPRSRARMAPSYRLLHSITSPSDSPMHTLPDIIRNTRIACSVARIQNPQRRRSISTTRRTPLRASDPAL